MRAPILLSSALALLALAGCAAAMPGYVPEKGRLKLAKNADKSKAADQQTASVTPPDGTYVLTRAEREYSCRRLTGVIQIKAQQLRGDAASAPTSRITSVTGSAMARPMAGGKPKTVDTSEHGRDRARLVALNNLMIEKNCGHFDLDAALDPSSTETPEPIRAAGASDRKRKKPK